MSLTAGGPSGKGKGVLLGTVFFEIEPSSVARLVYDEDIAIYML